MNDSVESSADCFHPQKDQPIVGQASGDQKIGRFIRNRHVGFVDVEPLAFVIPEECLYPKTSGSMLTSFLSRVDAGDQMDGFFLDLGRSQSVCANNGGFSPEHLHQAF
jgi:hypothetical protein